MSVFTKTAVIGTGGLLGASGVALYQNDKFDHQDASESLRELGQGFSIGAATVAGLYLTRGAVGVYKQTFNAADSNFGATQQQTAAAVGIHGTPTVTP